MSETMHSHGADSSPSERAWALHRVLSDQGLIPSGYIETLTNLFENVFDPANGAKIVARAWVDPIFKALLLSDGTKACAEYGFTGPQGEYIVAVEDSPAVKNVIVCSLCSCTNWPVLGLPPDWYKSFEYRARLVREGRTVLSELGTELPPEVMIKVWDTTAETRYLVLPLRPAGTEHFSQTELEALVTKDVLIGVALPVLPKHTAVEE